MRKLKTVNFIAKRRHLHPESQKTGVEWIMNESW